MQCFECFRISTKADIMHVNETPLSFNSSHNPRYVYIEALLLTIDICCLATKTVYFQQDIYNSKKKKPKKKCNNIKPTMLAQECFG